MLIKSNRNGFGRDSFCKTLITAKEVYHPALGTDTFRESSKYQKLCTRFIQGGSIYPERVIKVAKFGNYSYFFNEYNVNYISIGTATEKDYILADDEYTIDCWVLATPNTSRIPEDTSHIFGWFSRSTYNTCRLYFNGTTLSIIYEIFEGGSSVASVTYDYASYLNKWTHIAVCRNNDTDLICLYLDGVLVDSTAIVGQLATYDSPLLIGNFFTTSYSPINLYMDEFRYSKGIARYVNNNFIVPNRAYYL